MTEATICPYPYEERDDLEESGCWWEKHSVARKEHRCEECGGSIKPGTRYGKATEIYEGRFHHWKRCPSCLILAELVATITGECPLWGGLSESVYYANDELPEGATRVPTPQEFRQRWESDDADQNS